MVAAHLAKNDSLLQAVYLLRITDAGRRALGDWAAGQDQPDQEST